jgi:hypothetical protein
MEAAIMPGTPPATTAVGLEVPTAPVGVDLIDSSVDGDGEITALEARSIWELAGAKVERLTDEKGKKCWKCHWCGKTFKGGHNASKAVFHLAKVKGRDIQPCHVTIPSKFVNEYKAFWGAKCLEKSDKRKRVDAITEKIDDKQRSIAIMMESKRQRSSNSITSSSAQRSVSNITSSSSSGFIIKAGWESRLTMAIADFIHSKGLAFNATSGPYFAKMIQLARCVPATYVVPDRRKIGGDLLELSYDAKIKSSITELQKDADVFGLSMFGDGATVK